MTTSAQTTTASASRRAILAGALGGLGAWAFALARKASPVRAADGADVLVGGEYVGTSVTKITNSANSAAVWQGESTNGTGLYGTSSSGRGVYGTSASSFGIQGESETYIAIYGTSGSNVGVYGNSTANDYPATAGRSTGNSTGVMGASGGSLPDAKPYTGVYGYANQNNNAKGVWGQSPSGKAVMGSSDTGWAGYFNGRVFTERYIELKEVSNPSAPGNNKGRLFIRDNGSGKSQLCVRFTSGAVQVIATQP